MSGMPRPHLPYLQREKTRHGAMVWYVRMSRAAPRIRIKAAYGTPEFMAEYHAALSNSPVSKVEKPPHKESLSWLVDAWRKSSDWDKTANSTKKALENILRHVLESNGNKPFASIRDIDIINGRERRMKTPFAANAFIKTMRALFQWTKSMRLVSVNPTDGVTFLRRKTEGFPIWTIEDVAAYRKHWPIGTRQRVAMEVLFQTGLRRGDAVRLGRQHIGPNNIARLKAEKTGSQLTIPISASLLEILEAGPTGDLTFIVSERGLPLVKESFGTIFREWCNAAGVKKSAHGLRKLLASLVAEGGGTEEQLMALFGWQNIGQSQTYTRGADKSNLAVQAMSKLNVNNPIPAPHLTIPAPKK